MAEPDPIEVIRAGGLALEAARALNPGAADWQSPAAGWAAGPILAWMRDWTDAADLEARQAAVRHLLGGFGRGRKARRRLPGPSQFVTAAEAVRVTLGGLLDRPGYAGVTLPARFAAAARNLILAAAFAGDPGTGPGRDRLLAEAARYAGVGGPDLTEADYDQVLAVLFASDPRGALLAARRDRPGYARVTPGGQGPPDPAPPGAAPAGTADGSR